MTESVLWFARLRNWPNRGPLRPARRRDEQRGIRADLGVKLHPERQHPDQSGQLEPHYVAVVGVGDGLPRGVGQLDREQPVARQPAPVGRVVAALALAVTTGRAGRLVGAVFRARGARAAAGATAGGRRYQDCMATVDNATRKVGRTGMAKLLVRPSTSNLKCFLGLPMPVYQAALAARGGRSPPFAYSKR